MKIKNLLVNFILTSTSIGFGIILCELIGKYMGLGDPLIYEQDAIVGYRLKKLQSKTRFHGAKVSSDFEGFRFDSTKKITKKTKFNIFVGDSVTYGGSYIDDQDLFSSIYCNNLPKDTQCLNNGINSWGVLNMGRFISNFDSYSKRIPERFILVILPGDEHRNFRSLSDTPFWNTSPREPSAINEVLRYLNSKYFNTILEKKPEKNKSPIKIKELTDIQRDLIWDELEFLLQKSIYPIDIVITPPMSWFTDKNKRKDIEKYDRLLQKISRLDSVKKTCNLYRYILSDFNKDIYHDGIHLSKRGHNLWANNIYKCLNK